MVPLVQPQGCRRKGDFSAAVSAGSTVSGHLLATSQSCFKVRGPLIWLRLEHEDGKKAVNQEPQRPRRHIQDHPADEEESMQAFSRRTGRRLWRSEAEQEIQGELWSHSRNQSVSQSAAAASSIMSPDNLRNRVRTENMCLVAEENPASSSSSSPSSDAAAFLLSYQN